MGRFLRPQQPGLSKNHSVFFSGLFRGMGLVALCLSTLVSCSGVHSLLKAEYKNLKPVRSAAEIEILHEAPEKPHNIIGEVSLNYSKISRKEVIEKLKAETARLGGDGIILKPVVKYQDNWNVTGKNSEYKSKIGATRYRLGGAIYRYLRE